MCKTKLIRIMGALALGLLGVIACNLPLPKTTDQPLSTRTTTIQQNVVNDISAAQINGNVRFFLTDAPLDDVDAVNITVTGFKIKKDIVTTASTSTGGTDTSSATGSADNSATSDTGETSDESNSDESTGWVTTTFDTPKIIDLTKLAGGLADALGDLNLEPGLYKEIRLLVSQSEVVLKDGTRETLKIPSGSTSGLKIKFKGEGLTVVDGKKYALVLDFDLSKSLVRKGSDHANNGNANENSGASNNTTADADTNEGQNDSVEGTGWILKPVIKVLLVCEIQNEGEQCAPLVVDEDSSASQ